jgi:nucleotide-binding universal stress UspA family protein
MLVVEPMAYVHPDRSRAAVAAPPAEALRSLLVPVPRSGIPPRVVDRIGRLPVAHGATVTLVHVRSRFRTLDADALLADGAEQLASILPSVTLERVLTPGPTIGAIRDLARATGADLLVIAPAEHALRRLVHGATTTRIVRHSHCPVLVVRAEVAVAYQRPLVAIDFDEAAR